MNYREFVTHAVGLFRARKRAKRLSDRVFRGRSAKCDSDIEDLIALAIEGFVPRQFTLLVDQPITFSPKAGGPKRTVYPDIAIVSNGVLAGIVQVKIDLGYLREGWVQSNELLLEELRNGTGISYNENVGTPDKRACRLNMGQLLPCSAVILSGENDHGRMEAFRQQNSCFVLIPGHHPNSHDVREEDVEQFIEQICGAPSEWAKMEGYFRGTYN